MYDANGTKSLPTSENLDVCLWEYFFGTGNRKLVLEALMEYQNEELIAQEITYLLETKPENDMWGITWTWFDNMDKYPEAFTITETWWKGFMAEEKMVLLREVGAL